MIQLAQHSNPKFEYPVRLLAIDMGSNAIKHRIWEIDRSGQSRPLHFQRDPLRLGAGVFKDGIISRDLLDRAGTLLTTILRKAEKWNVRAMRAVTTSAMREAANSTDSIRYLYDQTGIMIEILRGESEAELVALSLRAHQNLSPPHFVLIDIGGGSSEIIYHRDNQIRFSRSLFVGAVRLHERILGSMPPTPERIQAATLELISFLQRELDLVVDTRTLEVLGLAGTITALDQVNRLEGGNNIISLSFLDTMIERWSIMDAPTIQTRWGLTFDRAEVILGGAMILKALLTTLNLNQIWLTQGGVLDGILQQFLFDSRSLLENSEYQATCPEA